MADNASSNFIFIRPPENGHKNIQKPPGTINRTLSTQYEDKSMDTQAIKQSTMGLIEETNSNEEKGGTSLNIEEDFKNIYNGTKAKTEVFVGNIQDPNAILRSMSLTRNPESPTGAIKNAQRKEALRKQFMEEAKNICQNYLRLDGAQLQIEGPFHLKEKDLSYSLVNACKELK